MVRPIDLMRRAMPVSEWPQADKDAWAVAQAAGDIFDDGGGAA